MANTMTLHPVSALGGFSALIGDTQVQELTSLSIVSIATPETKHDELDQHLRANTTMGLPRVGFVNRADNGVALLGLQTDQCFMVSPIQQSNSVFALSQMLGETAYLSDQSDSWVVLDLIGPSVRTALERICPIDLNATVFDQNTVARTSMEHLSVIIEQPTDSHFRLYSPRSSASGFLHAVTQSIKNISSTTAE